MKSAAGSRAWPASSRESTNVWKTCGTSDNASHSSVGRSATPQSEDAVQCAGESSDRTIDIMQLVEAE
jgi:hypothetical protein